MTNTELETRLENLVDPERKITREILPLILLDEDREFFLERGFYSLVRWLAGRYKYSENHRGSPRECRAHPEGGAGGYGSPLITNV